jgi:hypothetical protein
VAKKQGVLTADYRVTRLYDLAAGAEAPHAFIQTE